MQNNKEQAPQDILKINVHEKTELDYWALKFNCSTGEIKDAVASVGDSAENVAEYLSMLNAKKV